MLLPLFEWFETTRLADMVNAGVWQFAVIEAIHLLGLCLLGGALLVVDLRMLGLGLTGQTVAGLEAQARRWLLAAMGLMVVTGVPLMVAEPYKLYYNPSFWVKISTLPVALLFTFTIRAWVARRSGRETSLATRCVALASMGLWLTVAAAGRWIGFSS